MSIRKKPFRKEWLWQRWSFSKLEDLLECPLRFYFTHILHLPAPTPPLRAVGSSLHYMAFKFFAVRYKSAESFGNAWKHHWGGVINGYFGPGGHRDQPIEIAWNYKNEPWYWMHHGEKILRAFFERNAPRRGTGVGMLREYRFRSTELGVTVHGVIDRLDLCDGAATLIDYKMGRFKPFMLTASPQFTFYQLAYEERIRYQKFGGAPLVRMCVEVLSPSPITQEVPLRREKDFAALRQLLLEASLYVKSVLTRTRPNPYLLQHFRHFRSIDIVEGTFSPRLPRGRHCTFCPYIEACTQYEERKRPAAQEWALVLSQRMRQQFPRQLVLPFQE